MSSNTFKGKYGPLLIAEIGGNHEGDFEYAKKLTELAISTNVDFIKFQLYGDLESIIQNSSPKLSWEKASPAFHIIFEKEDQS